MKILSLISAGIDSPVASKIMLDKGAELVFIHFDNRPFTDDRGLDKAKRLVQIISPGAKLYIINHGKNQGAIMRKAEHRNLCILCRRLMFRIAQEIALKEKCQYLLTGENLGQVASQTLDNLTVTASAIDMEILRPLLCYDKLEIIKKANDFGTFETSIERSICCSMVPKHPTLKGTKQAIEAEEEKLDIHSLVKEAVETAIEHK